MKPKLVHCQILQTQIRCCRMWYLIRVCTVCLNYRKLRIKLHSLKSPFRTIFLWTFISFAKIHTTWRMLAYRLKKCPLLLSLFSCLSDHSQTVKCLHYSVRPKSIPIWFETGNPAWRWCTPIVPSMVFFFVCFFFSARKSTDIFLISPQKDTLWYSSEVHLWGTSIEYP